MIRVLPRLALSVILCKVSGVLSQGIPEELPGSWSYLGCYTDTAAPRTLGAISTINRNLTIEQCIAVCEAEDYVLAGVEYGQECFCDAVVQIPGYQVDDSECTMACVGNDTQLCGGPSRINIFDSGKPIPAFDYIINVPQGKWSYLGCYTDSAVTRTLGVGIAVPEGATPESCVAACTASTLGAFTYAGVEDRNECWCGTALSAITEPDDSAACRGACKSDHTRFCGNANRIIVYEFEPADDPTPLCENTEIENFTLIAEYKNPLPDGPLSVNLKVIAVEISKGVTWTLLTACPNCCSEWRTLSMKNSIIFPHSNVVTTQVMSSTRPRTGESPAFVASIPAFPGFQAFCAVVDEEDDSNPATLSFGGRTDAFALCVNNTADARVDLVFNPVANHLHYVLEACEPVDVKIITG